MLGKRIIRLFFCIVAVSLFTTAYPAYAQTNHDVESSDVLQSADSLLTVADKLFDRGQYTEAVACYKDALYIQKVLLDTDDEDYVQTLQNVFLCYLQSGDYNVAISYGKEVLFLQEDLRGIYNEEYLLTSICMANCYAKLGKYNDAIAYETESLNICKKIYGMENPTFAELLNNLALLHSVSGDYHEALQLGTEALNICEKVYGKEGPNYAAALSNLALYNSNTGNYNEAIRLNTESLNLREKVVGKADSDYAQTLNNLAWNYSALGNYREGIRLGTEALAIREKVFGKENPAYAESLNNLASYHASSGNYSEALRLCTEAMNIRETTLGKGHIAYAESLNNIAYLHSLLGHYTEAIRFGTEALNIYKRVLGSWNSSYATTLSNLALYNANSGNYAEAIRLGKEALNTYTTVLGEDNQEYVQALWNLSAYNKFANNLTEANRYYIEYLSVAKNLISKNFADLSGFEKALYWSKYEFGFLQYATALAYQTPSNQLTDAAYSGLLFAKGLLLNAEIELRKILSEKNDEEAARIYDELSANRRILKKTFEQPVSERTVSTDSLNTVVNNLERQLISISKDYGDYTKNLRIERKDVQAKLSKEDIAIEFATFHDNDTTFYCAYLLKKEYEAPKMSVCLKTTKQINTKEAYSNTKLSEALWGSLADDLVGVKNIYFGPADELYNIAIESLPDWENPSQLVSDRWNFYRLSSTRELAVTKGRNRIKQSVVYGGLTYDTDTASMNRDRLKYPHVSRAVNAYMPLVSDSLNLRAGVNELPGTKVEANAIDRKLKAVNINDIILTDTIGTETSFKALSGQKKNLLHIATHGFYWTETEAKMVNNLSFLSAINDDKRYKEDKALTRSGLLFAGANNALKGKPLPEGVDDGILTAQEIAKLDLRGLDLVVLSACKTGLGEITGDGVFGLQRGFKKAGAQSILMSLWKVDDDATQMLMTQFYTNLTGGMSKRQALLEAQRYVREFETEIASNDSSNLTPLQQRQQQKSDAQNSATPMQKLRPYADPKYWAAFILLDAVE